MLQEKRSGERPVPSVTSRHMQHLVKFAAVCLAVAVTFSPLWAGGAKVYLSLDEAPGAIFPDADSIERRDVEITDELRAGMQRLIGSAKPSIWEPFYISYIARKQDRVIGYAVICEEIGKHRPITFIVAARPDGSVLNVALMAYREPIGDEIRYKGFLKQFYGKDLTDPIVQRRDIKNITGATLSVRSMSRGVRKALAFLRLTYLESESSDAASG